jgi:phosphatidylglycerophosphate synthase
VKLKYIPNMICVVRMFLVAPIVWSLLEGRYGLALGLILVAGFSDALDGFLARRFDWRTRLGGLLDPAADKLLMFAAYVTLAWIGLFTISHAWRGQPPMLALQLLGATILTTIAISTLQYVTTGLSRARKKGTR